MLEVKAGTIIKGEDGKLIKAEGTEVEAVKTAFDLNGSIYQSGKVLFTVEEVVARRFSHLLILAVSEKATNAIRGLTQSKALINVYTLLEIFSLNLDGEIEGIRERYLKDMQFITSKDIVDFGFDRSSAYLIGSDYDSISDLIRLISSESFGDSNPADVEAEGDNFEIAGILKSFTSEILLGVSTREELYDDVAGYTANYLGLESLEEVEQVYGEVGKILALIKNRLINSQNELLKSVKSFNETDSIKVAKDFVDSKRKANEFEGFESYKDYIQEQINDLSKSNKNYTEEGIKIKTSAYFKSKEGLLREVADDVKTSKFVEFTSTDIISISSNLLDSQA